MARRSKRMKQVEASKLLNHPRRMDAEGRVREGGRGEVVGHWGGGRRSGGRMFGRRKVRKRGKGKGRV